MQSRTDIGYDQLVKLLKQLSKSQRKKLKSEIEAKKQAPSAWDMLEFLLKAPTFSKKQLDEIARAHKEISQWRTK